MNVFELLILFKHSFSLCERVTNISQFVYCCLIRISKLEKKPGNDHITPSDFSKICKGTSKITFGDKILSW